MIVLKVFGRALAECCLAGKIGAEVALTENLRPSGMLWESPSRIIISIRKVNRYGFTVFKSCAPYKVIGVAEKF